MAEPITLFCLMHIENSTDSTFSVEISKTATVDNLKELIKVKREHALRDVAAEITLWKVSISTDELSELDHYFDFKTKGTKLSPLDDIQDAFPDAPHRKHIHIVVELPSTAHLRPYDTRTLSSPSGKCIS